MKEMFERLGTPTDKKRSVAMPNTGNHVIASFIKSNDVQGVKNEIADFFEHVLKISPVQ